MSRRVPAPSRLLPRMVLLYLAFLLAGLLVAYVVPYQTHRYLLGEAEAYAATRNLDAKSNFAITSLLAYDADGTCYHRMITGLTSVDYDTLVQRYRPQLQAGRHVYRLLLLRKPSLDFLLVAAAPITDPDGTVAGSVYLFRVPQGVMLTVTAFLLCYTILYWMAALYVAMGLRRKLELEQMRRDYIANVSHDLKSPIASIKALAETLCDGLIQDPSAQARYHGLILSEANCLEHSVTDMLELSRIQSGRLDFSKSSVSADALFAPLCKKYGALCDDMGLLFLPAPGLLALPALYTNQERAAQLLCILLDNALKFVGEDGRIQLNARLVGKRVELCVRDNGPGIPKASLPHIFERFYKISQAQNPTGTGLGLAIAREIASGLDEKLWVESTEGAGAAFFFTICLA